MNPFNKYLEQYEDDQYEEQFYSLLKKLYPSKVPIYHESPIQNLFSIQRHGLREEGNFATLDQPSNFVISENKIIVKCLIPASHYNRISYDMPYDGFKDFLEQHPNLKGGDISYNDFIPPAWITEITIIAPKPYTFKFHQ